METYEAYNELKRRVEVYISQADNLTSQKHIHDLSYNLNKSKFLLTPNLHIIKLTWIYP